MSEFPSRNHFLRHSDIPIYLELRAVDFGIIGQNLLIETKSRIKELLKLNFGQCSLCIAAPKNSRITNVADLRNLRVATSYPNSTEAYFKKENIPIKTIKMGGSVEVAPALGVADFIVELVSTGITLAEHNLVVLDKIFDAEAILVSSLILLTAYKITLEEVEEELQERASKNKKK